jgi:hypothetical protein
MGPPGGETAGRQSYEDPLTAGSQLPEDFASTLLLVLSVPISGMLRSKLQ